MKNYLFIPVVGLFVGTFVTMIGGAARNGIVLFIGEIILLSSIAILILAGLFSFEGLIGLLFGSLISLGICGLFLYFLWPDFMPQGFFHDTVLPWIFAPLLIAGSGGAGVAKIIIVIYF